MSFHSTISAGPGVAIRAPDGRLPPDLFADYAAIVLLEPEPALLDQWIGRLERKLSRRAAPQPWSILPVAPGMERKARDALGPKTKENPHGAGLITYVPMETYRPAHTWRSRKRPLIPGYVLALIRDDRELDIARGHHAVRGVMCHEGKPVAVPAISVGALVLFEASGAFDSTWSAPPPQHRGKNRPPKHKWVKGQRVKVTEGPFAGLFAEIVKAERADRIDVLVDLLGRATEVELDEEMLETGE